MREFSTQKSLPHGPISGFPEGVWGPIPASVSGIFCNWRLLFGYTRTMNALEKYPLPKEESARLLKAIALSALIWLGVGIVLAVIIACIRTGGFLSGVDPAVWGGDIVAAMSPHWTMVVLPIVALAMVEGVQAWRFPRSESFRASTYKIRQGITGEMPRIPALPMFFLMLLTGFSEELVFRYGLIGLLAMLLAYVLPDPAAAIIALLVASIAFTVVHTQYKDTYVMAAVFVMALMMGATYLLTGSLLSVAFTHGMYNFSILLIERWLMVRQDDYFGGKVPVNELAEGQSS